LFVQFFGIAFNINVKGLNWAQWLITFGFSLMTIILRTILILITSTIFPQCGKTMASDPSQSIVGTLRRPESNVRNKSGEKEHSQKSGKKSSLRRNENQIAQE